MDLPSFEPQQIEILSPEERQQRHRAEMIASILQVAREIMSKDGVSSLNLNEIARRLGITTPAIYGYFESKTAIYDALYQAGIRMYLEADEAAWNAHEVGWKRIAAWIEARLGLARRFPEIYQLCFVDLIPGFVPSDENVQLTQRVLATVTRGVTEMIEAGELQPGMPISRAVDLLLAIRHGIVAEQIGKANVVPSESGRFQNLVTDSIAMLQAAWAVDPIDRGDDLKMRGGSSKE